MHGVTVHPARRAGGPAEAGELTQAGLTAGAPILTWVVVTRAGFLTLTPLAGTIGRAEAFEVVDQLQAFGASFTGIGLAGIGIQLALFTLKVVLAAAFHILDKLGRVENDIFRFHNHILRF